MNNIKKFSERFGFEESYTKEIVVRNDAPSKLRSVVIIIAYEAGFSPTPMRSLICRILRERPNQNNWSEYPNIVHEVEELIDNCEWYKVYDIIEEIYKSFLESGSIYKETGIPSAEYFADEVNKFFLKEGIGWQLQNEQIQIKGPAAFEESTKKAIDILDATGKETAKHEIHQALSDLSRRPTPDITGAIQHSLAALECVARDISGDPKATLGDILKKYPNLIPTPLDKSIEKAWGYASEFGRHLREGRIPKMEEAELLVGIASTVATYLIKKGKKSQKI